MLTTRKVNMLVGALKPRKIFRKFNIKIQNKKDSFLSPPFSEASCFLLGGPGKLLPTSTRRTYLSTKPADC